MPSLDIRTPNYVFVNVYKMCWKLPSENAVMADGVVGGAMESANQSPYSVSFLLLTVGYF